MIINTDRAILHLSLIPGIGIETIKTLMEKIGNEQITSHLYNYTAFDFQKYGFSEKKAYIIYMGLKDSKILENELLNIERVGCSFISFKNPTYPSLLHAIESPPAILYYKGADISILESNALISIVGSRKGNHYARQVINHFMPDFIKHNLVIVSGGALGVDTMAHEVAIRHGGKTIVVLGSGLAHLYPYQNEKLFDQIVQKGGIIISPFSVNEKPLAHNFPARNRIISGLSKAVIVVQAAKKSGAYITARYALEQGRDVFSVPGSIFDPLSVGCHALIKEGAMIADSTETVLNACFIKTNIKKEISQEDTPLYSIELQMLQRCLTPLFFEELVDIFDTIEATTLQNKLCFLQMEGKIKQDISGAFVTVQL